MKQFIRGAGTISPQNTLGNTNIEQITEYRGNRLRAIEPEYGKLIDVKLIRRMSRIIKMGVAAGLQCLHEAGVQCPDAIITGTAYGCLEDTGVFLKKLVENKEEMLTPTSFIQSTHNTIGAQIALLLQCHGYNNTFVHRGFSFESALLDGIMLLNEGQAGNVLVGGVDEITEYSFAITNRFGLYRKEAGSNLSLFDEPARGSIAGEGASFFLLANEQSGTDYGSLDAIGTFYKPADHGAVESEVLGFLSANHLTITDFDLVITGRSGDKKGDAIYDYLESSIFKGVPTIAYKHLSGEYPTSSSFALWLAASITKNKALPSIFDIKNGQEVAKVLVYNHYAMIHHSLMVVSAC